MTETKKQPENAIVKQDEGGFGAPAAPQASGMMDVASTRAAQEVQAAMVVAKKFPRDEATAYQKIMRACQRPSLASQAVYTYPRGNQTVTGPSIRLAEEIARSWGNIDFGIIELEQRKGESDVMAYAWDLETNTRQTKIFTVKHIRHTRNGAYDLTDPRDIYEMTANQGARRMRACILGVIPGDIQESAIGACEKTLTLGSKEPLADRIKKMVVAFEPFGVSKSMIEKRLGHIITTTSEAEVVQLQKIFLTLRDNMAAVEDYFPSETKALDTKGKKEGFGFGKDEKKPAGKGKAKEPKADAKPETNKENAKKPEYTDDGHLIPDSVGE